MHVSIVIAVSAVIILLLGLGIVWLIVMRLKRSGEDSENSVSRSQAKLNFGIFFALSALLVGGAGFLIYLITKPGTSLDPEVEMGLMVVAAIATLMTVLFILAAGFSSMNLTDPKQALGLPEGSIRAMIALVLIIVFIIFGIFLFRNVGGGTYNYVGETGTRPAPGSYSGNRLLIDESSDHKTFKVWVVSEVTDDGKHLAQQLITTLGTLVVAISSFYFGSSTASSTPKATSSGQNPTIQDVTPREAKKGDKIELAVSGMNFKSPKAVRLVQGNQTIGGTEIISNSTKIQCKMMIDKEAGEKKWDVVLENEDDQQARLPEVFTIKPA